MKTKHTKGPWIAADNGPAFDSYIHALKNNGDAFKFVAMVPFKTNPKETRANALLIAAAPEMLEALEYIQRELFKPDPDKTQMACFLKTSIEKARGES